MFFRSSKKKSQKNVCLKKEKQRAIINSLSVFPVYMYGKTIWFKFLL